MAYESELARSMKPYVAGEQPKGRTFIKINTNENPYPPSPAVEEAIRGLSGRLRLYPDTDATQLKKAIGEVNGISPERVFCGNGSDEVLAFAFAAFFAGKDVVSMDITYSFYPVYASLFGARMHCVPLKADFTVDVPAMMQGLPVALANPNAPTGILLDMEEVEKLAEHTRDHGEILLVDEAYAAFAGTTALPLIERFDNVLIIRTFSKSHALAGLRVGYAMGQENLIESLRRIRDSFNSYPTDLLAQTAAEAAVRDTEYTEKQVKRICATRDRVYDVLTGHGIEVLPSRTNFLFVKADPENAAHVQQELREKGILVRHFSAPRLAPYLRVTIGTEEDMEKVTEALLELCHT